MALHRPRTRARGHRDGRARAEGVRRHGGVVRGRAFRHGPLELAGPGMTAIVMATEPETRRLDLGLAADLVDAGANVLVVTPDGEAPKGARSVATGYLDRALLSAVSIVPVQLLAWKLAQTRGRTPGAVHARLEGHDPGVAGSGRARRLGRRAAATIVDPSPRPAVDPQPPAGELGPLDHRRRGRCGPDRDRRRPRRRTRSRRRITRSRTASGSETSSTVIREAPRVLARVRDRLLGDAEHEAPELRRRLRPASRSSTTMRGPSRSPAYERSAVDQPVAVQSVAGGARTAGGAAARRRPSGCRAAPRPPCRSSGSSSLRHERLRPDSRPRSSPGSGRRGCPRRCVGAPRPAPPRAAPGAAAGPHRPAQDAPGSAGAAPRCGGAR